MKKELLIKVGIVLGIAAMVAALVYIVQPALQKPVVGDTVVEEVSPTMEELTDGQVTEGMLDESVLDVEEEVVEDESTTIEEVSEGDVEESVQEGVIK